MVHCQQSLKKIRCCLVVCRLGLCGGVAGGMEAQMALRAIATVRTRQVRNSVAGLAAMDKAGELAEI